MKIIISPAKQMKENHDFMAATSLPVMLDRTERILRQMKQFDRAELKKLFRANDKITEENFQRYQNMDLRKGLTPAVLSYNGLAFNNMAPQVFTDGQWEYVKKNLKILSGFYGILNATDGVVPYRLEMQTRVGIDVAKDLYDFWGRRLYEEVRNDSGVMINLASREYSRCVEKYLTDRDTCITCTFGEMSGEKVITKGTYAKMARGEMVRFMAEHNVENPENMKAFDRLGYHFDDKLSSETEYVFIKE